MKIAVGCDHAGFELKQIVVDVLNESKFVVVDCGAFDRTPSDYPDFARAVAERLVTGQADRGILICGSGVGAAIAANKIRGIRAGLCHDCYSAHQAVEHDDMNVLCLGSRVVGPNLAGDLVQHFLRARFTGEERHRRRLEKIKRLEDL